MLECLISLADIILLSSFITLSIVLRRMQDEKSELAQVNFPLYIIGTCLLLSVLSAFWNHYSAEILLRDYNAYEFNVDSGTEQVEYKNVKPEHVQRVKKLERTIMGIGWPFKAIFIFIVSIIPVFVFTYLINEAIDMIVGRKEKSRRD